ncbi:costars family protein ABRACL-like isoform X1 [Styela clava]
MIMMLIILDLINHCYICYCVCKISYSPRMNVDHEVQLLVEEMNRLGKQNADGKISVTFGTLFADDRCANIFEALVGTLRAAKKKKIVDYQGELLLQGVHDNVPITLLKEQL